jgi:hypothetical protein
MRVGIVLSVILASVLSAVSIIEALQLTDAATSLEVSRNHALKRFPNTPQGGDPFSFVISVTLYPDLPTSLTYSGTEGVVTRLDFPPHTTDVTRTIYFITETSTYADGMVFSGYAFGLIPFNEDTIDKQYKFMQPVSLTIQYSDEIIPSGIPENQLGIYHPTGSEWILAEDTCDPSAPFYQDVERNFFAGFICEPAYYAIFGSHRLFLPVTMKSF